MSLDETDKAILRILIRKRRTLSATVIKKLLWDLEAIEISRPTVSKRLIRLKKEKWVIGNFMANPKRFPKK